MNDQIEQTKPKKSSPWKAWFLGVVVVLLLVYNTYNALYWPKATVKVGSATLSVIVSDTNSHNIKGLSGRKDLGGYDGMLFYFPTRDQHTMVMREMLFPLDIIWIDRGVIIDVAKNLSPENGKTETELTPYMAREPSTMVLELSAGQADAFGLKVGDRVVIAR